jgi:hypothetical protein
MTPATLRRQTAIGMISELYLPTDPEMGCPAYLCNYYYGRYAHAAEVADNISKLAQLGRTARWQAAIKRWAAMVREADHMTGLRHAFLQGMIYAGHASE